MNPRTLLCKLCAQFYQLGWVSGTGGGLSIRIAENQILIAPSGVQKERLKPWDLFLTDLQGNILQRPKNESLRLSECTPLFLEAYTQRNAGAVIHSHSINAVIATNNPKHVNLFAISGFEMQKGIKGYGVNDRLTVPVIKNTERESQLTESLAKAIETSPQTQAVLVKNHGVYVWGDSWEQAKTHAECYDYLFEISNRLWSLGK